MVGRGWKVVEVYGGKRQRCFEQTVSRNLDLKHTAGDDSERSEEHIFVSWRKKRTCYVVAENSRSVSFTDVQAESVTHKPGSLAREIYMTLAVLS